MDKKEDLIEYVEDRPGHDYRYSMSSEKIFHELNWSPKVKFEQAIQDTISWYLNYEDCWMNVPKNIFNPTPWKD